MNRITAVIGVTLFALASITLTGCASKPVDELQLVRVAMEEAQSKEASTYAPEDWDRGRWHWEMANSLIAMGNYGEARNVLVVATGNFNTARDIAASRLEAIKKEVQTLQTDIKLERAKLTQAEDKPGNKPIVRQRIEGALPQIDDRIATMQTAVEEKDFLAARRAGKAALYSINNLREALGIAP